MSEMYVNKIIADIVAYLQSQSKRKLH